MAVFAVKELDVCFIAPATPTTRHFLPVSTFDLMQKRNCMPYLQRVAFYAATDQDSGLLIENLKRSLPLVLVHFFPFAGRLSITKEGRAQIDCNDSGVEFCEAATDSLLSEIDYSQPSSLFRKLIHRGNYEVANVGDNIPLLTIQATKFKCGSICIAWAFDHIVADGNSLWHFITSWAEVSRGGEVSRPPIHSRTFEHEHVQLAHLNANNPTNHSSSFSYTYTDASTGIVAKIFRFSEQDVEKLRSMSLDGEKNVHFSTYELLSAHVWRAITLARSLSKTQKTTYLVACNCRSKLTPPLPEAYFGNAILMATAEATAGELEMGSFSFAVGLVHEAIKNFSIDSIVAEIRNYRGGIRNPLSQGIDAGVNVWHGGSLRLPLYEADFGWGRPIAVRNVRCLWDGFCYIDPSPKGGRRNAEIMVCLRPQTLHKFCHYVHIPSPSSTPGSPSQANLEKSSQGLLNPQR